jgi:hypothetical protein
LLKSCAGNAARNRNSIASRRLWPITIASDPSLSGVGIEVTKEPGPPPVPPTGSGVGVGVGVGDGLGDGVAISVGVGDGVGGGVGVGGSTAVPLGVG